jgi:hypothetical protein
MTELTKEYFDEAVRSLPTKMQADGLKNQADKIYELITNLSEAINDIHGRLLEI